MSSSPPDVAFRRLQDADAEVAALMISEAERAAGYRASTDAAELRDWWSRTDLAANSWALDQDGSLAAIAWLEVHAGVAFYDVQMWPASWDEEVARRLVERVEERTRELGLATLRCRTLGGDERLGALLEQRGYAIVRRFQLMAIESDERPPPPRLPEGITIEPFRREDARAFHETFAEAFRDEWAFVPMPFEEWYARRVEQADTSFYFVARAGDEIAGVLRGEPERRDGGFVGGLGVRERWRGRGVGEALLRHAFRAWYDAGRRRVSLGVDSQNPTGAMRLYERVGMHVELEDVIYEKEIR